MTDGHDKSRLLRDCLLSLRPSQWTKNAVVLAAFFFAVWDAEQALSWIQGLTAALPAALLFCLASSGIYVLNDIKDKDADRLHPTKRLRPIAAGRVPIRTARWLGVVLLGLGLAGSWLLSASLLLVVAAYVTLQLIYIFALKRVALLDILVIAAGFVLRAIGGAVVIHVTISPWLLLCAFLLALFLALCKRRHEKAVLSDITGQHRPSLDKYDERLLDQLIAIISAATIVSYAIYTLSADTIHKFGTAKLGFTIPFVMFGIFRYLDLVYRHEKGGRPEKILISDIPILVNLVLYALVVVLVFVL
jgi:4-hydroxybenzoate polyprenyltransferase